MAEKDFRVQKGIVVADGDVTLASDHTVKTGVLQTLTANYIKISGNDIESVGSSTDVDIDFVLQNGGEVNIPKVDIDDGTIDGVTIATSDIDMHGKTLDLRDATNVHFDNDQISGNAINGGTIGSITITELAGDVETKDILMSNDGARDITVEALTGTNDTGRSLTINAGLGDGTGTGGSIVLKGGGAAAGSGNGATTHTTGLTVHSGGQVEIDNVNIDGGNIDGTVIGAATKAAASVTTLLATSHARVNGTAKETTTLLQVNGGTKGGGASGSSITYSEGRLHSDISNDDLAGTWNSYLGMSAAFILDNAENASGIGQGVIFTEGRTATSGSGTTWAIGRQRIGANIASANTKFTIGFIEKSYEDVGYANASNNGVDADSPMAAAQSLIEINTYGDLQLVKGRGGASEGQLVFSGAASDSTAHTIKLKAPHNTMTADQSYTLPVAPAASSGYVLSATTAGVMSWVAQSGGIGANLSSTDNRIVRMDGTDDVQGSTATISDGGDMTVAGTISATTITSSLGLVSSKDTDGEFIALTLTNQSDAANTTGIVSQLFNLEDTGGTAVDAGKIAVKKEQSFTATGSTQDSSMVFSTSLNGTLTEKMTINSDGEVGIGTTTPSYTLDLTAPAATIPKIRVKSVNSSDGPQMIFEHDDGSTAQNSDQIGTIKFLGESADDSQIEYGRIGVKANAVATGNEGGRIEFYVPKASNGAMSNLDPTMSIISGSTVLTSTVDIACNLVVDGNLTVSGDTITANVGTLDVEDKNITLNKSSSDSSSTADGAGITIQDAVDASNDASLTWNATNDDWQLSHTLDVTGSITATGTLTAATSLTLDSVTVTDTEIGFLNVTAGTATASKALVVDGSKNIGTLGTVTAATLTTTNFNTESISVDAVAIVDTSTADGANIAAAASNGVKELAQFAVASYRTVKYVGHIHDDTTNHTDAFEVLVTYNGGSGPADVDACYLTTYAYMNTGTNPLGSLSVTLHDGSGGTGTSHIGLQFANATTSTAFSYSVVGTHIKRQ